MDGVIMEHLKIKSVSKCLERTKSWGKHLFVAGLLGFTLSCGEKREEPLPSMMAEPYYGTVLEDESGNIYMEKRLILSFKVGKTKSEADAVAEEFGGRITGWTGDKLFEIEVIGNVDDAISLAHTRSDIEYSSRNYYFKRTATWDNETYITEGERPVECNDDCIDNGVWWSSFTDLTDGLDFLVSTGVPLEPVTIAIIDQSFNLKLDITPNNPEIPYVDEKYHYNFADSNDDIHSEGEFGLHGSNIAAFAAASNNSLRTNGVAAISGMHVLPFRVHSDLPAWADLLNNAIPNSWQDLSGDDFRVSHALEKVLELSDELNIKVVNLSLGRPIHPNVIQDVFFGSPTRDAIAKLYEKRIIVVAAAGNDNEDACNFYPSAFPAVISVGGTKADGLAESRYYKTQNTLVKASNYSTEPDCLEVAAPSQDVIYFHGDGEPHLSHGTSLGSPQVAGLVALMMSVDPDLSFEKTVTLLRDNADEIVLDSDPVESIKGRTMKRINVERTLKALITGQPQYSPQLCDTYPEGHENRVNFTVVNDLSGCGGQFAASFDGVESDGSAQFVFFQGMGPLEILNFTEYQQITVDLLGLGPVKLELCGKSTSPCGYTGTSSDANCTATLAGDKRFICE